MDRNGNAFLQVNEALPVWGLRRTFLMLTGMGVFVLLHSCVRSFLCVYAAGYFWSLYMTATRNIGMPAHTAQIPDYATRVCHNMTTSLPVFSILYPSIRRYTVKQSRESESPVDCQSLKRRGGLLHNLLCSVNRVIRTPFYLQGWFEALSLALYSISESIAIVIPKMVKGKKADTTGVKLNSIQAGAENSSSQPQSPPSQAQKSLKDLDETPPPSRSPSPPPSPTHSARSRESQWSIDIEELSDEPRSAVPTKKDNKRPDRRRSSSWSRSLMNSFRKKKNKEANLEALYKTGPLPDDFPAKSDEELDLTLQSIEPAVTVVVEERTGPVENVQIDESMEETKTSVPVQDEAAIVAETRTKAPSVERSIRMSKMLSFGTFGRRKSMTAPQEQSKSDHQESENQENPEIEVEAEQEKKPESKLKPKADKKGKLDEVDGESGEVKPEGKSNKREKSKSKERKFMKNEKEKLEENIQVIDEIQIEAGSVPIPTVAKVEDKEKSKSSLKRPTVAKVEKKEKSKSLKKPSVDKVEEKEEKKSKSSSKKPTADKEEKESKSSVKKSKSNHKSIFSFKVKSVEKVQPEMDVEEVQLTDQEPESTSNTAVTKSESPPSTKVKPKRKSIADLFKREKSIKEEEIPTESEFPPSKKAGMFRNSFARSKKTKSMDVETIPHEEIPENDKKTRRSTSVAFGSSFSLKKMFHSDSPSDSVDQTPDGILNKRSKKNSSARPKSVQLDGNPLQIENVSVNSQTELRSSRSKFGERFMSFTRDSLRIKKQQRSKSDDRVLAEVADETLPVPIAIEAEDKNVTAPNATEKEGMRTNASEIPANPVAESVTPEVQVDEAVILSTLHLDYEPKHGILRAWFRILLLYCVHEAISRPLFEVVFCFVCILCLISFGFLVAANFT